MKNKKKLRKDNSPALKHKTILFTIIILLLAILLTVLFKPMDRITSGTISSELQQQNSITPKGIDFPDTKGGTFAGWAGEQYFQDAPDEVMVLFTSSTVPGLAMIYYPYQERVVVGTPQMIIEKVPLFNGEKHLVAYSFVGGGEQKFYYDGELKASGPFELYQQNEVTGMVTGTSEAFVSELWEKVEIS